MKEERKRKNGASKQGFPHPHGDPDQRAAAAEVRGPVAAIARASVVDVTDYDAMGRCVSIRACSPPRRATIRQSLGYPLQRSAGKNLTETTLVVPPPSPSPPSPLHPLASASGGWPP